MDTERSTEEMMREVEAVGEPGEPENVIHVPDDDTPLEVKQSSIQSAGWVKVYDTLTGESSIINRNMLPHQLQKKRTDGTYIFTTVKPLVEPQRGHYKCLLHADDPNRKDYDALGFAVCRKANLSSPYQVRRHMMKRHPVEWGTIQEERENAKREEDRTFQRTLMARMAGAALPLDEPEEDVPPFEVPTFGDEEPKPIGGRPKGSKNKKKK